ncbi:MAG: oligopeptide transporter, OPT family [Gemmatimonadetes bacterium]|nr:MAG: oligopeptide transporter, OPT family [Gemmatimonadetes bacterium 13_1_40CM_3_66_12]PYP96899.1 MAG: oligopeptide transporter, OPT family [Gemmatimonadota bacterium]
MTSIPAAHPAPPSARAGATHQPYIPASQAPAELTLRAIVLGVILGLIFGASNVYLALKIGLTVSASIPIAVLSITIFRWLGRSTILENNIVQTTGSAADSVSAGVVFTIPAILLMGYDLDISRVTILAIAGGLMGVLMMIPLRRALIVKEHGNLPYPEGTACAEVLIAGERGGIHAKTVFQAFGIAFVYKFLMTALKVWQEYPGKVIRSFQGAEVRVEASPELIGVGYIIGPRIAGYLFAGGCLAYVVLMPAIKLFGSAMTEPMFGTTKLIRDMSAGEIRAAFVFYIGAGAVASAGIIALARSLPTIVGAFRAGFADMRASRLGQAVATKLRTDDDLPISLTVFGSIVLAIVIALLPQIGVNLLGGFLIIIFGFFFTTVSSRICGQVGSSANPISGMTIAALIAISFIFLLLGWNQIDDRVRAISIACVIAVAVANGGNTSQDLKTGFLVGATPRRQQIAILIGAIGSALAVGWTLTFLNSAYSYQVPETRSGFVAPASGSSPDGNVVVRTETMSHFGIGGTDSIDNSSYQVIRVYVETQGVPPGKYLVDPASHEIRYVVDPGIGGRIREYRGHELKRLDSPKATLMALITDGILTHRLPWALVLIGVFLTIAIELMGVSSLPVAVGVYLPITTSAGMFAGGIVRWLVERRVRSANRSLAEIESGPGVLFASGLIAGGAICGIAVAAIAGWGSRTGKAADWLAGAVPLYHQLGWFATSAVVGLIMFAILGFLLYRTGLRRQ